MLNIQNYTKRFGDKIAVDDLSLHIAAHELKEIMAEHCRNGGAIFFSTHVLEVAEKLCDNVAIIKNGKLIAHGTMDSVRGDGSLEQVFLELEDHKD